jgi:hypothetical protein
LPKRHNGLESSTVYVLVTDNKFDFYNITEIADKKYRILDRALKNIIGRRLFTIHQLVHSLIINLEKFRKIQIQNIDYNRGLLPFRPTNYKTRQRLAISSNDTSNQKGCKFYHSCLFSYEIVKFNKL